MAILIGTKGKYDTEQGYKTQRSSDGELQIIDKLDNFVDSVVDNNKIGNKTAVGYKSPEDLQKEKQAQAEKNERQKAAFGNVLQSAGQAAASATKPSPVSNPQAQHNARQAALAENQAAKLRTQQQQANQIANRTSTTTGAMNEAQKVAEQSALQKQRLASQQMVGDAGLANAVAAKAGAEVDPSQHFSEIQALGSQERQRAIELGKQAYAGRSAAEFDRAKTTAEIEEKQVRAKRDQQAEAASYADAARQAAQDKLNANLINSQIAKNEAESAKASAEGAKASAEGQKTSLENTATTTATENTDNESKIAAANKIIARIMPNKALSEEEMYALYNGYIAASSKKDGSGSSMLRTIAGKFGGKDKNPKFKEWFLQTYRNSNIDKNPNWSNTYDYINSVLSDSRMKAVETPIGHALMNIWKGRTM